MTTGPLTVDITAGKTWLYWPLFRIMRRLVRDGLVTPEGAAANIVRHGMKIEVR